MLRRLRERGASTRLIIILVVVGISLALISTSERPGRLPQSDWYAVSRQRLLQADLTYRVGLYLDLVAPADGLPAVGSARQLKEKAIADYEREVLIGKPNPVALHRLGIVYGDRGYLEQARQAFLRAAALDREHEALFYSLAAAYAPDSDFRPLGPTAMQHLQAQERWLTAIVLPTYYTRLHDRDAAARARVEAATLCRQFGQKVVLLLGVYGSLGCLGLIILLVALFRWGFRVHPPPTPRPTLVVPWGALDALEVVATLYFGIVFTGILAGTLLARLGEVPDVWRVAVWTVQYLAASLGVLWLVWQRTRGLPRRKLSILGVRFRNVAWQIAQGIGGYAVLVVILVLITLFLPGGSRLGLELSQTGERLMSTTHSWPARTGLFVLVCVVAPILEEIIFRGFVFPGLRRRLPAGGAVAVSAVLFGLMHNNPAAMAPITMIGVVLAVLYERNLSVVPSIVCHALNNTLVFFLMLLTT